MKKIVLALLAATLLTIIVLMCFIGYYGIDYMFPMIAITAIIASVSFLAIIAYCIVGIYINSKKE